MISVWRIENNFGIVLLNVLLNVLFNPKINHLFLLLCEKPCNYKNEIILT